MDKYSIITGVTGFLGAELAERLIGQGAKVIGVGRQSKGFLSDGVLNNPNFVLLTKDIKDLSVDEFKNYEVENIFHLASIVEAAGKGTKSFEDYIENSIKLTTKVLNLAQALRVKCVVYSSTMGVIGGLGESEVINESSAVSPMSNYNLAKYVSEKLLELESFKNTETKYVTLRFPSILGKNHAEGIIYSLKEDALNDKDIELYGRGEYLRNILYVDDAVDIMVKTVQNVGVLNNYELFAAGSKKSLSVKDIAQKLVDLTASKSKVILSDKSSKNNFNVTIDISKSEEKLGFCPMTIEQGLERYIKELNL